jgi:hypothetical protein
LLCKSTTDSELIVDDNEIITLFVIINDINSDSKLQKEDKNVDKGASNNNYPDKINIEKNNPSMNNKIMDKIKHKRKMENKECLMYLGFSGKLLEDTSKNKKLVSNLKRIFDILNNVSNETKSLKDKQPIDYRDYCMN